jgi:hypothetical protein
MLLVQLVAPLADSKVAHLALDAARVEATAAADALARALARGDLLQEGGAPALQPLRGEGPRPAASFA